jgi:hypothetical protein
MARLSLSPGCFYSAMPDPYLSSRQGVGRCFSLLPRSVLLFGLLSRVQLWEHSHQGLYKPLKMSHCDLALPTQ